MKRYTIACLFLIYLALPANILAQITSATAFMQEATEYPGGGTNDPIFYYENMASASLDAPMGTAYQWYKYSPASKSFEVQAGATMNYLSPVSEGGYRVEVRQSDGSTQDYYCWNFVPQPAVDSIQVTKSECGELELQAIIRNKELNYYDHRGSHNTIVIDYGISWQSAPEGTFKGEPLVMAQPEVPYEDTKYTVTVGSRFSPSIPAATATKDYKAIAVLAKFKSETPFVNDNEAKEGSALMEVRLTAITNPDDLSLSRGNIETWEWNYDDVFMGSDAILLYPFDRVRSYPVTLTVKNEECNDTSAVEVFTVSDLEVSAPTAFTPFSSIGENDVFRVAYRSVNKFTMLIYNRWGRKIFQTNNPAEGWDGRIAGRKAEPGAYFVKIEATGFKTETGEIPRKSIDTVVHLIVTN